MSLLWSQVSGNATLPRRSGFLTKRGRRPKRTHLGSARAEEAVVQLKR